jgi:indole-3-glycerol phosphate synthase
MMNNFLDEIVKRRRERIAMERKSVAQRSPTAATPHRLRAAITDNSGVNIIAEFKRASPSRGVIRENARVAETVALYEMAGARAISILTEPNYFRGSLDDLREAREATQLPILQKDFIVDQFQIDEASATGADAILLIVAALQTDELLRLRQTAEDRLGLDALVEVHTEEEMRRAADCGATLIGVNNRDLRTFVTSLETSVQLAAFAPSQAILVSESGISTPADIARLQQCGYHGFLIGESLMRSDDPAALIHSLRETEIEAPPHV